MASRRQSVRVRSGPLLSVRGRSSAAEQRPVKPLVGGSSPLAPATSTGPSPSWSGRLPDKQEVSGSTPLGPTTVPLRRLQGPRALDTQGTNPPPLLAHGLAGRARGSDPRDGRSTRSAPTTSRRCPQEARERAANSPTPVRFRPPTPSSSGSSVGRTPGSGPGGSLVQVQSARPLTGCKSQDTVPT